MLSNPLKTFFDISEPQIHTVYSKRQTRAEEIEKCQDEGLEPTYYLSIFKAVGIIGKKICNFYCIL